MSNEETYFSRTNVLVTSARVVINGTTYPVRGISAVRAVKILPNRTFPILLLAFGAVLAYFGYFYSIKIAEVYLPGFAAVLAGGAWLALQRPHWVVELATAGMQQNAVVSNDEEHVSAVAAAIARAIVEGK